MAVERALKGFADHSHAAAADLADDVEFAPVFRYWLERGRFERNYRLPLEQQKSPVHAAGRRGRHPTISSDDDSRRLASVSHVAQRLKCSATSVSSGSGSSPRRNADSVAGQGHTGVFIGYPSRQRPSGPHAKEFAGFQMRLIYYSGRNHNAWDYLGIDERVTRSRFV